MFLHSAIYGGSLFSHVIEAIFIEIHYYAALFDLWSLARISNNDIACSFIWLNIRRDQSFLKIGE